MANCIFWVKPKSNMLFSELPNRTPSDGNFVRERKDFENTNCKVNFEHFSLSFVKPIIEDDDDDGDGDEGRHSGRNCKYR